MAYHIRRTDGVCKPPKGAVFKRHGAERLGKRYLSRYQGKCKGVERN